MADRGFTISVHIDGDSNQFTASLKEAQGATNQFRREVDAMNRAMGGAVGSVRTLRDSVKALSVDVGFAERAMTSLTRHTREARDNIATLSGSTKSAAGIARRSAGQKP